MLVLTLDAVDKVNDYVILIRSKRRSNLSKFGQCMHGGWTLSSHEDIYTLEFLNSISSLRLPNHNLTLKVSVPILLLYNIDQIARLCNVARLQKQLQVIMWEVEFSFLHWCWIDQILNYLSSFNKNNIHW